MRCAPKELQEVKLNAIFLAVEAGLGERSAALGACRSERGRPSRQQLHGREALRWALNDGESRTSKEKRTGVRVCEMYSKT